MECQQCGKGVTVEESAVCPYCGEVVCLECYERQGYRCKCDGEYKYFN